LDFRPFAAQLNYDRSHPNIIQICGAAQWGNIYATLFHDGADFDLHLKWVIVELDTRIISDTVQKFPEPLSTLTYPDCVYLGLLRMYNRNFPFPQY
jgi:hypothetical protein